MHYNLLHHPFDEDTKHAINANSLTGNGNIAKSKTPPLIKDLTAKQELEQETTIPNFLKCMATTAAGPLPSDDNATIQHLKQPPQIISSTTLDKLREEARNSNTTKTLISMPHLNQAALLAGTDSTPNLRNQHNNSNNNLTAPDGNIPDP